MNASVTSRPLAYTFVVFEELAFYFFNPSRQACKECLLFEEFLQWSHGGAEQNLSPTDVFSIKNARLPSDEGICVKVRVFSDADLSSQNRVGANCRTPGNSGLRCDDRMFPNLHVVRDLDQIVEFGSTPDDRSFKRAPVDAGIGSDL